MHRQLMASLMMSVIILLLVPVDAVAGTWRVEQDGSGDFATLQPAVNAAADGDTILIGPGWYQELHWVDHYGSPIEVAAYWMDDKDLFFIGSSADEVKIGPATYAPYRDGPQGIFHEGLTKRTVWVSNIEFSNLFTGVNSSGAIEVYGSKFQSVRRAAIGLSGTNRVHRSQFLEIFEEACVFITCTYAEVVDCILGSNVYFGNTETGIIRNCIGTGRSLASYWETGGLIEDSNAICDMEPCISANQSTLIIRRNQISGGYSNLTIMGETTNVTLEQNTLGPPEEHNIQIQTGARLEAHGNDIIKATGLNKYLVRCVSYPGAAEPTVISMENNYWADAILGGYDLAPVIATFINDYNDDPYLKILVDFEPFSIESVSVEKESLGSIKAMFR